MSHDENDSQILDFWYYLKLFFKTFKQFKHFQMIWKDLHTTLFDENDRSSKLLLKWPLKGPQKAGFIEFWKTLGNVSVASQIWSYKFLVRKLTLADPTFTLGIFQTTHLNNIGYLLLHNQRTHTRHIYVTMLLLLPYL